MASRIQLAYKTQWNGGRLLVADRWYPSSKTCSGCGAVKAKLALHEREYECEACGLVIHRDRNASLNLAALAAEFDIAGSGPVAARGADQKTRIRGQVAVKREPGTTPVGQTGTVPPQGATTNRVLAKAH
ncbi:transposase [Dactylosporangium sp. NBC_01737]|uniref:zinc ribbon domain-containing protein n=1 Tax=Dactylosporangium sp. NBC_01737 TaxID=2975959 RepID=UPI002E131A62|nr:transposase [Dactylosporangium sp. NBC_01737]